MSANIPRTVRLPPGIYDAVTAEAKRHGLAFDDIVIKAIERDLATDRARETPPSVMAGAESLIDTEEVARRLKLSVLTVRRRARTPGDPLRRARSRIGPQKPMHFHADRIVMIEREGFAKGSA
jgi:hypothetical protein